MNITKAEQKQIDRAAIQGVNMFILLYCIETDPANCHWREYDSFRTLDAANAIMRAGRAEYPSRTWKIVS